MASIGLIHDDVPVIIGAMVIAPLLGPILALAFGVAIGERRFVISAIKTNAAGLGLTLLAAAAIGWILPLPLDGDELMGRTDVGLHTIALALAAGAAGVLSLTTGLSGALVGVMVAVALMPPAVSLGLFLGGGEFNNAYAAALHLMANIVSISLAAQLVFLASGIRPRSWYKRKKSEQSVRNIVLFWVVLLLAVAGLILFRDIL